MHNWQPFPTPSGKPNDVRQEQCAQCGVCRTFPNPNAPNDALFWWLPDRGGFASTFPTPDEPPCRE